MTEHVEQQLPVINDNPYIHDLVSADLLHRKEVGRERYGTPLQADNGRDVLRDAYEESLDQSVYLRQAIEERDLREKQLKERFAHVLDDFLVQDWEALLEALADQARPFIRTEQDRTPVSALVEAAWPLAARHAGVYGTEELAPLVRIYSQLTAEERRALHFMNSLFTATMAQFLRAEREQ